MSALIFGSPLFGLFRDRTLTAVFEAPATLAYYGRVEAAITRAAAAHGLIDAAAETAALDAIESFAPDWSALESDSRRDGLPVPGYVSALRSQVPPAQRKAIHVASTSQDIMDTALALALRDANLEIAARLDHLLAALQSLLDRFGDAPLAGRTRMQLALPVGAAHRIGAWLDPLRRQRERLPAVREGVEVLQFGGPVGLRDGWGEKAGAVAAEIARQLDLAEPGAAFHTARDNLHLYGAWLCAVSQALGKIGLDIALMAQQGLGEVALAGGGSSSAMAHKQNPVAAELLVTLARFNAGQLGLLAQSGVHEQERSGISWALEWMVLPQMCLATGLALSRAAELIGDVTAIGGAPK